MDNKTKKIIGYRISAALAARNKKQKELAAALGVTDNTISFWCSGKRTPNFEQIISTANILNVSTDYLLGLTDSFTPLKEDEQKSLRISCDYTGLSEETIDSIRTEYKFKDTFSSFVLNGAELKNYNYFENFEKFISVYLTEIDNAVSSYRYNSKSLERDVNRINQAKDRYINMLKRYAENAKEENTKESFDKFHYKCCSLQKKINDEVKKAKAHKDSANSAIYEIQEAITFLMNDIYPIRDIRNSLESVRNSYYNEYSAIYKSLYEAEKAINYELPEDILRFNKEGENDEQEGK